MADQVDWPNIYINSSVGDGGVGSEVDPYNSLSDINWTTGGDNSVYDYYNNSPTASVTINLKKDSEWRVQWGFNHTGSATYPIKTQTYGAGADPKINGSDLVTTWANTSGNIWEASFAAQPQQVWVDGSFGNRKTELGGPPEVLVDSLSSPLHNASYDCNANFHVNVVFTYETGKYIRPYFRYSAYNSNLNVSITGTAMSLREYGTEIDSAVISLTNGIQYTIDVWGEGSNIRVDLDTVNKIDDTTTYNQDVTGGSIKHDLVTNDIELESYSSEIYSLSENLDWYYDSGAAKLYLYDSAGNPANHTSPGVEAGARNHCIYPNGAQYISFNGIHVSKSKDQGLFTYNSSNVAIKNCTAEWVWNNGIRVGGNTNISDILIEDCVARYNGNVGVSIGMGSDASFSDALVHRNKAYENAKFQANWAGEHAFTSGFKFFAPNTETANFVVEDNESYDNGPEAGFSGAARGGGIWFDACSGSASDPVICRYNLCYDNTGCGVFIEIASYVDVFGNLLYDNSYGSATSAYGSAGVKILTRLTFDSNYNKIYNNTIYGGAVGILVVTSDKGTSDLSYNIVKNNIAVGQSLYALSAFDGGDNDGVYGDNNVYEKNCFGAESSEFINWDETLYDTYDTWLAVSSQTDNNVEADPSFTNAAGDDYTLASDSPCIDAGVNLGSPYNIALMPDSTWPSGVVTGDQDDY